MVRLSARMAEVVRCLFVFLWEGKEFGDAININKWLSVICDDAIT